MHPIGIVTGALGKLGGAIAAGIAAIASLKLAVYGLNIRKIYLAWTCEENQKIITEAWKRIQKSIALAIDFISERIKSFVDFFTKEWGPNFTKALDVVQKFVAELPKKLAEMVYIGRNAVIGLWEGFNSMRSWISERIAEFARSNILGTVQRVLGINSPSKVFADKVGKAIVQGVAEGIDDEAYVAEKSALEMAQNVLGSQKEIFELSFIEIAEIVIRTLDQMARNAIRIMRDMAASIDAMLQSDGFRIGRNFFRALGDGLVAEEAALLSRAWWVADEIRRAFASWGHGGDVHPSHAAVNAANSWAVNHPDLIAAMAEQSATIKVPSIDGICKTIYGSMYLKGIVKHIEPYVVYGK